MAKDELSQYRQRFITECLEDLWRMESALLTLRESPDNLETINTIFRIIHSTKGGAGILSLEPIVALTHAMEAVLAQYREGVTEVTGPELTLLLESIDCLRQCLGLLADDCEPDAKQYEPVIKRLGEIVINQQVTDSGDVGEASLVCSRWRINFCPSLKIFQTGNDPKRIFHELQKLGDLTIKLDMSQLPAAKRIKTSACYLTWTLFLNAEVTEAQIAEVFEWVAEKSFLEIIALHSPPVVEDPVLIEPDAPVSLATDGLMAGLSVQSIQLSAELLEKLIVMSEELSFTQAYFESSKSNTLFAKLSSQCSALHEMIMGTRFVPISKVFQRFPRIIHDTAQKLNKQITLKLRGERTMLDRLVLEKIGDPLTHLIRNALDHGLETTPERQALGKSDKGSLTLSAEAKGNTIRIEIEDDGRGLDRDKILNVAIERGLIHQDAELSDDELYGLIFVPGFSTADEVGELSGRGVGMDVVAEEIKAMNGTIDITSIPGQGTRILMSVPCTLMYIEGLVCQVGSFLFAIPKHQLVKVMQYDTFTHDHGVGDIGQILDLHEVFAIEKHGKESLNKKLLQVRETSEQFWIEVDEVKSYQKLYIKAVEDNYRTIEGICGAAVLSDQRIAYIVDVAALSEFLDEFGQESLVA